MAEITLKVDTAVMNKKAGEIKKQIQNIRKKWDDIQNQINNSTSYWEGEASNKHIDMLKKESEEVEAVLKRLDEYPSDLAEMAGFYLEAEKENEQASMALPVDVIM